MKRYSILFIVFLFVLRIQSFSQLQVFPATSSAQITQFVQNILVGQGVTISNVTYTGNLAAIGRFQTGAIPTTIGYGAGMILASGNVTNAIGPNNSTGTGNSFNLPGNTLLTALSGFTTYDASVLEFDFVPLSDSIKFQYVFASEEYDDYVNSSVNDVFGFFVSGMSPFGGFYVDKNIAIIPGTNIPVTINDVNNGNCSYNQTPPGPCEHCQYYTNNNGNQYIQYDGKTTVLTAQLKVIPCLTYHIKIAISDAGDGIFDSGVFLKANSFTSSSITFTQAPSLNIDTMAIENCSDAIVTFSIPTPKSTQTYVNYYAGGTATSGLDYTPIPSNVIIPAGQTSTTLTIHPVMDSITENNEYILFIISTSPCTYDSLKVWIKDNKPLKPDVSNDTVLCNAGTAILEIFPTGGQIPYSYLWSSGDTIAQTTVSPLVTQTYTVTLTDICLNDTTAEIVVKVSDPDYYVEGDTVCPGQQANVVMTHNGISSFIWNTGATSQNISVTPTQTTSYFVTVTDTLGCVEDTSVVVVVSPSPTIVTSNDTTLCKGNPISLQAYGGIKYSWNTGDTTDLINFNANISNVYIVTVTNTDGCTGTEDISVDIVPYPSPSFSKPTDTICKGGSTTITVSGADVYLWNTGATTDQIFVSPKESTTYMVTFTNESNGISCQRIAQVNLGVKKCNYFYFPSAFTPNGDNLNETFGAIGAFEHIDFYEMVIYDRWGRIVFTSKDPLIQWDGRINGKDEPLLGVYTYHVFIQETYGELFELNGTVHVVR